LLSGVFASLALWQWTALGYATLIFWPSLHSIIPSLTVASIPLCMTALFAFTSGFLEFPNGPLMRVQEWLTSGTGISTVALAIFPDPQLFKVLALLFAPILIVFVGILLREAWRGAPTARQLALAMMPLFATFAFVSVIRSFNLAIDSEVMQNLLLAASVFCGVVLAATPATRIRALSQERSLAEQDARLAQDHARESEEKAALAERENRAKTSFLATMSHEIRTPMNGVLGMAELLLQTRLDDQQSYYIATLKRSGQALMGILNDVLDYSKVEAGHVVLEHVDVDLLELLDDLNLLYREHLKRKSLDFHTYLHPDVPLRFASDPTRLKQVVRNIINNAIKFSENGQVTLSVFR